MKKKVLFILPAMMVGGAERVLITLMNSLDRELYEPQFLSVSSKGKLRDLIDPTIPIHCLDQDSVYFSLWGLYKKIRELKPDVVMSTMAHMNFMVLLLRPLFSKVKFIVREAITPSYILREHYAYSIIIKTLYRVLYPLADAVISPAYAIQKEFYDDLYMKKDRHMLLYNPVNEARIREFSPESYGDNRKQTVRFVAAGRLNRQKGFDRLIRRLPYLENKYNCKLDILGEGEEHKNLQDLIYQLGLQDRVTLVGLKRRPWPYYASADCFVMPSRWEGMPNVVLESLAAGTPVIATRESGGIDEIAERCKDGAVTVSNTMDEFLKAMAQVKPNPVSKHRSSLVAKDFQYETVIKRFHNILEMVIART